MYNLSEEAIQDIIYNQSFDVMKFNLSPKERGSYLSSGLYYTSPKYLADFEKEGVLKSGINPKYLEDDENIAKIIAFGSIIKKLERNNLDITGSFQELVERYSWHKWNSRNPDEVLKDERLEAHEIFVNKVCKEDIFKGSASEVFTYLYKDINFLTEADDKPSVIPDSTPREIVILYILNYIWGEVHNGGWEQVLYNSGIAPILVFKMIFDYLIESKLLQQDYTQEKILTNNVFKIVIELSHEELEKFYVEGIFSLPDATRNKTATDISASLDKIVKSWNLDSIYHVKPGLEELFWEVYDIFKSAVKDYI